MHTKRRNPGSVHPGISISIKLYYIIIITVFTRIDATALNNFLRNQCRMDRNCMFIHPTPQHQRQQGRPRSLLCYAFNTSEGCSSQNCRFRHIKQVDQPCRFYIDNECRLGEFCPRRHVKGNQERFAAKPMPTSHQLSSTMEQRPMEQRPTEMGKLLMEVLQKISVMDERMSTQGIQSQGIPPLKMQQQQYGPQCTSPTHPLNWHMMSPDTSSGIQQFR